MKELCELRIDKQFAHLLLDPGEGTPVGNYREVVFATDAPRFDAALKLQRDFRRRGKWFFMYWNLHRRYTRADLEAAELFTFFPTWFEPEGESCGTQYDYSDACSHCGLPRRQVSNLFVDLRKAPKRVDVAQTLAGEEWIVSQRLAESLKSAGLTGFELRPVHHNARHEDDPIDWSKVPSGRELLRQTAEAGFTDRSGPYYDWLNAPKQAELVERAQIEHAELLRRRAERRGKPMPVWHQLVVTSRPVRMVPPTRFGADLVEEDPDNPTYCCPYGHVAGFKILSEVSVARDDWDGSDIARSAQLVGHMCLPSAEDHPAMLASPTLLMSPRFRQLLLDNDFKSWGTEVAYLR